MTLDTFDNIFSVAAQKWNVPVPILEAIAKTESSLRARLITDEGRNRHSYGLFQLLDSTARGLGFTGDWEELLDPVVNTDLAAKLIRQIMDRQRGLNLGDLYSEYNSGRPGTWRQTTDRGRQVAANVSRFLKHFADSAGITLPPDISVEDAVALLNTIPVKSSLTGLLVVLSLILFFHKTR